MEIIIYTMKGCGHCTRIKELIHRANVPYVEKKLDIDFTREELLKMYPKAHGYPVMTVDGEFIGSLVESVKYFVEKGMVSARK